MANECKFLALIFLHLFTVMFRRDYSSIIYVQCIQCCIPCLFVHSHTQREHLFMLPGSMQDYNYIYGGCMELTIELSCCKFPVQDRLSQLWEYNKNALISFVQLAHIGKNTDP